MDPLHSFLRKHRSNDTVTHLSLIGGKYCVPREQVPEFRELYCKHRENAFLVEKALFPMRFFIDLDHVNVDDVVRRLNTDFADQEYLVCVNEDKDGVHVVFKNLEIEHTDQIPKLLSRTSLAVDRSVYKSGLRMIGSRKKLGVHRVYRPYLTHVPGCPDLLYPETTPFTPELLSLASIHTPRSKPAPLKASVCAKSASETRFTKSLDIAELAWTSVERTKSKDFVKIQTRMKFCKNINREHKNNHVYFVLDVKKRELYQKCYCTCDRPDLAVNCRDYRSGPIKIPMKLYFAITDAVTKI